MIFLHFRAYSRWTEWGYGDDDGNSSVNIFTIISQ